MNKLIEFIRSVYVALLFVVIEVVAVNYYAHSSYYTQARLLARSNQVAGGAQEAISEVKHFLSLRGENRVLVARVEELQTELDRYKRAEVSERLDAYLAGNENPYVRTAARVVSNSISKSRNFVVLNRGKRNGVTDEMAVLSPAGAMIGYVVDCSQRYAVAISVLNTSFRTSGKLEGSDYFGSIFWDGSDPWHVTMDELSKYAEPKVGDKVVSTGFSQYFPPDIPIGTVESFSLNESRTAYTVRVRLTTDMTGLGDVILVRNTELQEVQELEQSDKVQDLNVKK